MKLTIAKFLFGALYLVIMVILLNAGRHYIGIENTLIAAFALLLTGQFEYNVLNDRCKSNCDSKDDKYNNN